MRWVGDPRMASKWTHGMCFDPQKILEQYLTYFKKYPIMNFAEKSVFWAFFKLFWAVNAAFKGNFTVKLRCAKIA